MTENEVRFLTDKVEKIADFKTTGKGSRENYGSAGGFWQLLGGSHQSEIEPVSQLRLRILKKKVSSIL